MGFQLILKANFEFDKKFSFDIFFYRACENLSKKIFNFIWLNFKYIELDNPNVSKTQIF
jgi:hypothetical protein